MSLLNGYSLKLCLRIIAELPVITKILGEPKESCHTKPMVSVVLNDTRWIVVPQAHEQSNKTVRCVTGLFSPGVTVFYSLA